jgi:hypothetical protein
MPNSKAVPYLFFMEPSGLYFYLLREYIRACGITNEAELWIKHAHYIHKTLGQNDIEAFFAPLFCMIKPEVLRRCDFGAKLKKAKELVETYGLLLDSYAPMPDGKNTADSGADNITKDDAALMLEHKFALAELSGESLVTARIMLLYIEPLVTLFNPAAVCEEALPEINAFIESLYGKKLDPEAAAEQCRAVITAENEAIQKMNGELRWQKEMRWPLLEDGGEQKKQLEKILVKKRMQINTLGLFDVMRIRAELQPCVPEKRHRIKIALLSKIVSCLEKRAPPVVKIQKRLYSTIYTALEKAEKALDVCGWHDETGSRYAGGPQGSAAGPALPAAI